MYVVVIYLITIDFFFAIQVWITCNSSTSKACIGTELKYTILFILCLVFLIIPTFFSIFQLQNAISIWIQDPDTKFILRPWITKYIKLLYLLSIIFGSSFTAMDLCNCYIFKLDFAAMGLPWRNRQVFKNQRILSIVLLGLYIYLFAHFLIYVQNYCT